MRSSAPRRGASPSAVSWSRPIADPAFIRATYPLDKLVRQSYYLVRQSNQFGYCTTVVMEKGAVQMSELSVQNHPALVFTSPEGEEEQIWFLNALLSVKATGATTG